MGDAGPEARVGFGAGGREPRRTAPSAGSRPLPAPTSLAGVVHQDDFGEQAVRRAVDNAVHGAEQSTPGFVVKHDHHACVGQFVGVDFCLAPAQKIQEKKNTEGKRGGLIFREIRELRQGGSLEKGLRARRAGDIANRVRISPRSQAQRQKECQILFSC